MCICRWFQWLWCNYSVNFWQNTWRQLYIVVACNYIDLLLSVVLLSDLGVSTMAASSVTVSSTTTSTLTMSTAPAATSGLTAVTTSLLSSTADGGGGSWQYLHLLVPQHCQVLCMCIVPVQLPQLHSYDSFEWFLCRYPGASADTAALGVLQQIAALLAGKLVKLLNFPMKILCVILYRL